MAVRFLMIAVVYFVIGIAFGIYMGMHQLFQFAPVHAHINLLGWASMAIMGIVYHVFPNAARSKLAPWHFWLYNIGIIPFIIGLVMATAGNEKAVPLLIVSSNVVLVSVVLFAINVWANVRETPMLR